MRYVTDSEGSVTGVVLPLPEYRTLISGKVTTSEVERRKKALGQALHTLKRVANREKEQGANSRSS